MVNDEIEGGAPTDDRVTGADLLTQRDVPNLPGPRRLVSLARDEALALLAEAPFGRIVFTEHALPAIRLVNHVLVEGRIVIRTHRGAALTSALPTGDDRGTVVVYQADAVDTRTRLGWSVTVTGYARLLTPEDLTDGSLGDGHRADPAPWFDAEMTHAVVLDPEIVNGMRMVPA